VKILSQTFSWSFNGNVLMMIQVVENWICAYKPYQLLSIHVIKKHDPLSIRRQRLSVLCRRPIHTATTDTHRHVADTSGQLGILSSLSVVAVVSLSLSVNRHI
jgi:hypothetical protein